MAVTSALLGLLAANSALAYPWVASQPGVDSSLLGPRRSLAPRSTTCPANPNPHVPAVGISAQYPYLGAANGQQGTGVGNVQVPAPGDTAHYFQAPGEYDIRGPCPGLNTAANHGFLARDGITTYNELVDAQQNLHNVGYDLANLLALAGVGLDGDLVGTGKLSLGCDATDRTALAGNVLADELGLDGHNHFEADTSLTRNDYFLADGDNHTWNATLFKMMLQTCDGNCNRDAMATYRYNRYQQSKAENGNFFFGPGSLLLYGAASFLYELFPTNGGTADEKTMMSFFGANKTASGDYVWNGGERIPDNWFNRAAPYTDQLAGDEISAQYQQHPVAFGGNVGQNNFNGMSYSSYITNGTLNTQTASEFMCLIYQTLTGGFPSELGQVVDIPAAVESVISAKLAPMAANFGCPLNFNSGSS